MRILMLAPQPFFEPRGTPFSVLGRLRALSALGHEVDLLTYHVGQDVEVPGVAIHRTPRIGVIKSLKIGPSLPKVFLDGLLLVKAIGFLLRRRYDLIHTHEEASFFGVLLSKLFRTPHLYDMHSSPTEQLANFRYTQFGPLLRMFDWIERRVIKSSDAIITICPALEERVEQISEGAPQVMIENVASEGVLETVSEEQLQQFRSTLPQLEGRRIVLYAGTFEPYQGIDLLIGSAEQVVDQCEDVVFLMVGGRAEQVEYYRQQVRERGLSSRFHFTGTRPPEEIPMFMALSSVLVSPRTDGTNTPLKIYSYLLSGKPIVATDLRTHTQVLNDDVAVLVEPNPQAFGTGLLSVLRDDSLATRLGENARQLFEANYSFRTYVQKTEKVLQQAVG